MITLENLLERLESQSSINGKPFPYLVVDDFLPEKEYNQIAADARNVFNEPEVMVQHGNRKFVTNTSMIFERLVQSSSEWKQFHEWVNSQVFFDALLRMLISADEQFAAENLKHRDIVLTQTIRPSRSKLQLLLEEKGHRRVNQTGVAAFTAYKLNRLLKNIKFQLHRKWDFVKSSRNAAQLLFDISLSGNGYGREIHRDSDGRVIVFLYYLNDLDEASPGGTLNLHSSKSGTSTPRPSDSDCVLEAQVVPKKNRLVAFLNSETSYHSVETMKGHTGDRLFCYGGFTLLTQPVIKVSEKMTTEFDVYL